MLRVRPAQVVADSHGQGGPGPQNRGLQRDAIEDRPQIDFGSILAAQMGPKSMATGGQDTLSDEK